MGSSGFTIEDAPKSQFTVEDSEPAKPSFNQQLTEIRPWAKFDTSHPIASAANEVGIGLGNIGAGAISAVEGIPSMIEHPIQSVEGIPRGMYEMGKIALTGHPEYALGQMIPTMAAGEAAGALGIPKVGNVRAGLRDALTTEKGALKPLPSALSRAAGAGIGHLSGIPGGEIAGAFSGPSLLKSMLGKRSPIPEPELGTAENPGWVVKLPNRMPNVASGTAGASPKPVTQLPSMNVLPEPRAPFEGENEGYMASIPRGRLMDLARTGKPGAGTQLQQLGKHVIYIPKGADIESASIPSLRQALLKHPSRAAD